MPARNSLVMNTPRDPKAKDPRTRKMRVQYSLALIHSKMDWRITAKKKKTIP
jgi:hypothetical protein